MSISKNSQNLNLDTKRHSFAHIMAAAVQIYFENESRNPKLQNIENSTENSQNSNSQSLVQFGVGPVIENGCFYDFILPRPLVPNDLKGIEKTIRKLLKQDLSFKRSEVSLQEAIEIFTNSGQPLKVELLENLRDKGTTSLSEEEKADFEEDSNAISNTNSSPIITLYSLTDNKTGKVIFEDLCKGPHVENLSELEVIPPSPLERGSNSNPDAITELGRFSFNNKLVDRAKEMLDNPTKEEGLVWENILKSKQTSYKFSQQKIIDNYILDFYCSELLLAIEVDGGQHKEEFDLEYDKNRDSLLNSFGIKVARIENKEVENIDKINQKINQIILERKQELEKTNPKNIELEKPLSRGLGYSLDKFSASYWRGDQVRGINMQRLYALVFETSEELEKYQTTREEAKKRDHRKLGQEMEIFMISEDVGAGLPLYLPNGATIRQLLEKYCYQEAKKSGYQYVYTPHIGKSDLFAKSGHLDHYADGMYAPIDMVNLKGEGAGEGGKTEKFYLKPMNCPMHHNIYLNKPKSYRDLPYRLYEYGTVYRYEESGSLSGMIRVRGFTQNDAHVYCQRNQLKEVIGEALNRFIKAYEDIGVTNYKMRFSLPDFAGDPEKYGPEETLEWKESVSAMRQVLDEMGVNYYDAVGEAAFYGPKIDIQVKNVNGKEDSLSTIQVDYSIAPKFGITYKNALGEDEIPAIIHMALMGSVDRFMAFMLEMTGGRLPFWLAATQVKILTINNQPETLEYTSKIKSILEETVLMKPLKYNEIRFEIDERQESLGKKIREGEMQKIPVLIIVGPKDILENQVSIRTQNGEEKVRIDNLMEFLKGLK